MPALHREAERRPTAAGLVRELVDVQRRFDAASVSAHERILERLQTVTPSSRRTAVACHDALLFSIAYAPSRSVLQLAEQAMDTLTSWVVVRTNVDEAALRNSGLPGASVVAPFSLALNAWLLERFGSNVELHGDDRNERMLVHTLNHLLDPVEREMLHAGKTDWETWAHLITGQGDDRHRLKRWIVTMTQRLPGPAALREHLFEQFESTTLWRTTVDDPVHGRARASMGPIHVHDDGLRRTTTLDAVLRDAPPRQVRLTRAQQRALCDVAKATLCGMLRETDPVTHADERSTEFFDMGRGLGIALFYATAEQKMALQSYVGFMAFKNRVPIAYGGGWVLGFESGFGVNIFPMFRGGESSAIVAQLLRLYVHHFGVRSFTVDPYQIGLDNPDGIASASFWFYYRLGFRPMEPALNTLAERSWNELQRRSGHRTPVDVLKRLAYASMRWTDPEAIDVVPITADRLGDLVSTHVNVHFDGDRDEARRMAMRTLSARARMRLSTRHPVAKVAVVLVASGWTERATPAALRGFINDYRRKAIDEHGYARAVQRHADLFTCLAEAEQALDDHL